MIGPYRGRPAPRFTLADEHDLLFQQVAVRTEVLLSAAEAGCWTGRELQALLDYLRAEVIRQVGDEEALLFGDNLVAAAAAGLIGDHVRLRRGIELLAEAAIDVDSWSPPQIGVIASDLLAQLERHCIAEEAFLAPRVEAQGLPATSLRSGRPHEWYPLTEGALIDVGALPADGSVEAIVDRLLRMRRGEQVELRSDQDLHQVWRWMRWYDPGGYRVVHLLEGPPRWRVLFTRRPAP